MTAALRPMREDDLPLVVDWLRRPHVQRWWRLTPDLEAARGTYVPRLTGAEPTHMLTVLENEVPVGLAQWYRWDDYPRDRDAHRVGAGELGIDHAIGEVSACYRRLGTGLVARLLNLLRGMQAGGTPVSVTPEDANAPSRRILEKNGFELVAVFQADPVDGAHPKEPTALYRRLL